jgi:histidine triad (HIT) family protein
MADKKDPVVVALAKASKGLEFPSETDAPFAAFAWKGGDKLTDSHLLELAGEEPGTPVESMTLAGFFRVIPQEDKAKFDALANALGEQLTGVKVYKVGGEAEKHAYIVGKTQSGQWAGLRTTVVET